MVKKQGEFIRRVGIFCTVLSSVEDAKFEKNAIWTFFQFS